MRNFNQYLYKSFYQGSIILPKNIISGKIIVIVYGFKFLTKIYCY